MNEFLFLGTSGGQWDIPSEDGFYRRDPAALINGELLIDCGKDIFESARYIGNNRIFDNVTDVIITHNHYDHFNKESVLKIAEKNKIRLGCDKDIMKTIGEHPNIDYVIFLPYETKKMGKYEITPLLSNHQNIMDEYSCSFHYIIRTADKKCVFYGLDGAWFLRPSWEMMKKHKFSVMVFDCTVGDISDWRLFEHNTIPMLRMMIEGIKIENISEDGCKLLASHMAKELNCSHEETEKILSSFGMMCAYDGMKLCF